MSVFNPQDFESPQNITVPIQSRTIELIGTQVKLNTNNQFRKICAKFKIVNEDPTNNITYRIPSPSAPLRTVPPSTSTTVEEYTFYLEFNLDASNTKSYVELDLINVEDGKRRQSDVGNGAA